MPSLELVINSRRMPYSTLFSRWMKAPEHLYYLLLFSTNHSYANSADAWRSWLQVGFNLAVKDAPPAAAKPHRIRVTVGHQWRRIEISIDGGDRKTLADLEHLLQTIEKLRPSVTGREDTERATTLMADKEINAQLMSPLKQTFKACSLRVDEVEALRRPLAQALYALTDDYITSLGIQAKAGAAA